MESIELKITLLAGAVTGVIMLLGEMIAMHRKVARYRDHLRGLYRSARYPRLIAECAAILAVALIQPVIVSVLLLKALDNFDPDFSAHAVQQLQQGVHQGNLDDPRRLGRDQDQ